MLLAVVSVLVVAAIYELVVAVMGVVGAVSGEAPSGEPIVYLISLLAIFLGALLALAPSRASVVLLAPAASAFVTARFYTADPYYAPTLRRYSDGGLVAPAWIFALAALSLLAGLVAARRPQPGAALAFGALVLLFGTALFMGAGH
ncbi:MAG: hypothetical protein ACXVRK_03960 [Gaiellaceae bacterium]